MKTDETEDFCLTMLFNAIGQRAGHRFSQLRLILTPFMEHEFQNMIGLTQNPNFDVENKAYFFKAIVLATSFQKVVLDKAKHHRNHLYLVDKYIQRILFLKLDDLNFYHHFLRDNFNEAERKPLGIC